MRRTVAPYARRINDLGKNEIGKQRETANRVREIWQTGNQHHDKNPDKYLD